VTILIVDDFPPNRTLLKAVLVQEGFEVIEASDGIEALRLIESLPVDAIISDILMPNMDGYRLCTEVRRRERLDAVPFLFHTSTYTSHSDEALALSLGADRFIRKPIQARAIVHAVRDALDAPRPVRRQIEPPPDIDLTAEYTQRLIEKLEEKNQELFGRTQEAHGASERLRALISAAPVAICSSDAGGIVRIWNPAAERIFGWKAGEIVGRQMAEVFADLGGPLNGPRNGGGAPIQVIEKTLRRKDSAAVHAEMSVSTIYDADGIDSGRIAIFADFTERKKTREALEKAKVRMETLSRQLLAIGEAERLRIARELHDEIGQGLTAAKLAIEAAKGTHDAIGLSLRLDDAVALIGQLLQSVRRLSLDLRPAGLDELGLVATLRAHLHSQAERVGLRVRFLADEVPRSRDAEIDIACFRVAQEAMTNIIRHARATAVEAELRCHEAGVRLVMHDNGVGFDTGPGAGLEGGESFGLLSMRERVQLAGGRFLITSGAGRGTRVEAWFPW
jgi:PAS domain S-box-containing protein